MKLIFERSARRDLEAIGDWIAKDNPRAAIDVVSHIRRDVDLLLAFPKMGAVIASTSARKWPVPRLPYIVVYRIDEARDALIVLAVVHAARDRRP
ncbi:MAG: type II toxin-antitoxin system RelE/ParE family toxin [Bauldia sp.]|nr:type II toxin-antitoxin system RelE/ParE family toxin [Bauldia sp.]